MDNDILTRKGARNRAAIPASVLTLLNQGSIPTVNLVEWLAIDQTLLAQTVLPQIGLADVLPEILVAIQNAESPTTMKVTVAIGAALTDYFAQQSAINRNAVWPALAAHPSDSVRCWAAYVVGLDASIDLTDKLVQIRPFAADNHFGVREIAWMAVRPTLTQELTTGLKLLQPWVGDEAAFIRRFASELTRPRGVWCKQIKALIDQPVLGLPLLAPLCTDTSKYVQDSVANWLNDASKSDPAWVTSVCEAWRTTHPDNKATAYIIKRALRSVSK